MTEQEFLECRTRILKLRVDGDAFQLGTVALRLLEVVKEDGERMEKLHTAVTRNAFSSLNLTHVLNTKRSAA